MQILSNERYQELRAEGYRVTSAYDQLGRQVFNWENQGFETIPKCDFSDPLRAWEAAEFHSNSVK